jgi:hypothetical protein
MGLCLLLGYLRPPLCQSISVDVISDRPRPIADPDSSGNDARAATFQLTRLEYRRPTGGCRRWIGGVGMPPVLIVEYAYCPDSVMNDGKKWICRNPAAHCGTEPKCLIEKRKRRVASPSGILLIVRDETERSPHSLNMAGLGGILVLPRFGFRDSRPR